MNLSNLKKPSIIILAVAIVISAVLATISYRMVTLSQPVKTPVVVKATPTLAPTPTSAPTLTPTPILPPVQDPSTVLGIDGVTIEGVPWIRVGYPSCGWGKLRGTVLKDTVQAYHKQNVRVLLTLCQQNGMNMDVFNDAAQGLADAVQCGNEQMKQDAAVAFLYVPPANFARFYDQCERATHAVRPDVPVLLGSLDPHVGGVDYQPLVNQVYYLDQMQAAMNSSVRPGSNWEWRKQTLGLIDSWHNGWSGGAPNLGVNSLYGLFSFWAQQFRVDLNSGALGKHLWVVEGTGCFKGCGVNPYNAYDVAGSHIMSMIVDVQTATKYKVPFFYFSGKDFFDQGINWPIGILDANGKPKPIRQDLSMGARTLVLSCPDGNASVVDQAQLIVKLYAHCNLPGNYISALLG